jgi:Domain of unknown function (DUF3854)/Family of unknown function (DUF5906)
MTTKKAESKQRGKGKLISGAKAQLANAARHTQEQKQKAAAKATHTSPKPRRSAEQQRAHEWMLIKLKESGLDAADADALGYQAFTSVESKSLNLSREGQGFGIPFFNADGEELETFQYRYAQTEITEGFLKGAKQRKYDMPSGSNLEAYLPRIGEVDWSETKSDAKIPVVITEGPLKAAACTKLGRPCIALTGVDCFSQKKKGYTLIPSMESFEWQGRHVTICYDSDATTKEGVIKAENRLASELDKRGALVSIVRLTGSKNGGKRGIDDFIVEEGAEATKTLLNGGEPYTLSRELHALSEQYGFIHDIAQVIEYPTDTRPTPLLFMPETFVRSVECHRKMKVNPETGEVSHVAADNTKTISVARRWLESMGKPTWAHMDYAPGQERTTATGGYNTWLRPAITPLPGDTLLFDKLVEHLIPDADERTWFLQWAAAPLQQPGIKLATAVLLWSQQQGNGKTLLGSIIGRLHGVNNYVEITQAELDSTFNGWMAAKTFIHGSEVCGERDSRALADKLKTLVTSDEVLVNEKHKPAYKLPNVASLYMTSNHTNALFIDDNARRFMVLHASRPPLPQKSYSQLCKWLDHGGLGMVLHKLMQLDLAAFEPKASAPKTEAMKAMVHAGRSDLAAWCHQLREDADSALTMGHVVLHDSLFTSVELLHLYENGRQTRVTPQAMGNALAEAGFKQANNGEYIRIPNSDLRLKLWIVRDELRIVNLKPNLVGAEYGRRLRQKKAG